MMYILSNKGEKSRWRFLNPVEGDIYTDCPKCDVQFPLRGELVTGCLCGCWQRVTAGSCECGADKSSAPRHSDWCPKRPELVMVYYGGNSQETWELRDGIWEKKA